MTSATEIQDAIRKLAGTFGLKFTNVISGNVTSVSEDDRTCIVTSILSKGEIVIPDVNLSAEQNDGFIQIPAVDSTVLIAQMPDGENYVIAFSDIDKVICFIDGSNKFEFDSNGFIWNGGLLGGLANINVLKTALNLLQADINALKTATGTAITVYSAVIDGGVSASVFNAVVLPQINITNIEDTKIQH